MKKIYIRPEMQKDTIEIMNILAGSLSGNNEMGSGNQLGKEELPWDDELNDEDF